MTASLKAQRLHRVAWRQPQSTRSAPAQTWGLEVSVRPKAIIGHPIRIAVIRARRYAPGLSARWVASTHQAVGCCFVCLVILGCA